MKEPDPGTFDTPARARVHFNRLTMQVCDALSGRPLILALDNFEALECAVDAGAVGKEIYQYLLSAAQGPQIILAIGKPSELDTMTSDYRRHLHNHAEHIRLSPLPSADAWTLITNPSPDFALSYEPEAAHLIIHETEGHPYHIQHVCFELVNRLNQAITSGQDDRCAVITLKDVEAAIEGGILDVRVNGGAIDSTEDAAAG